MSSAVFGTVVGGLIDLIGRKEACLFYCALEVIINLLEHSVSFKALLLGRVLGGISTSLLFSAFESWMVAEHRNRRFSEDLMSETFSKASVANGFLAILAGIVSHTATHYGGILGPFQLAIVVTVVAAIKVSKWNVIVQKVKSKGVVERSNYRQKLYRVCTTPTSLLTGIGYSMYDGPLFVFGT